MKLFAQFPQIGSHIPDLRELEAKKTEAYGNFEFWIYPATRHGSAVHASVFGLTSFRLR